LINPVVKEIDYSEHINSIYLSPIESLAEVYCLDPNDIEESHKEAIEFLAEDKINKIKYDENNDLAEDFEEGQKQSNDNKLSPSETKFMPSSDVMRKIIDVISMHEGDTKE
jgi:hypothetical protein